MSERKYDVVLFGATGFTGGLTAEYLAANAPADFRLALAGRNQEKLAKVRGKLAAIDSRWAQIDLLTADVTDAASLRVIAEQASVVATTVGPYLEFGEPLVAACAAAGTGYLDLTGEPEFVDQMYLKHHKRATQTGARLIHCCGFDSIPHDLGVLFTVKQLPTDGAVSVRGVVRSNGAFSGGTFHSALGQFSRAGKMQAASNERRKLEQRPADRKVRGRGGKPGKDPVLGYYLMPLPTVDPIIVKRSAAARADYGPDFTYEHFAGFKTLRNAAGMGLGVPGLFLAAQVPPLRKLMLSKVPQGEGPSDAKREKSWFTVDFIGEAAGTTVRTQVSGGDPGYTETAKMLAEAALCLALDDNPQTSGQTTTAAAMGENLIKRLDEAGIRFTVKS